MACNFSQNYVRINMGHDSHYSIPILNFFIYNYDIIYTSLVSIWMGCYENKDLSQFFRLRKLRPPKIKSVGGKNRTEDNIGQIRPFRLQFDCIF